MPAQKSTQNLAFILPKMLFIFLYINYIILTLNLGSVSGCGWSFAKPPQGQIPEKIKSLRSQVSESVVHIDDSNWNQILEGEWMVVLYADWCLACQKMECRWNLFGDWCKERGIKVGRIDMTVSPVLTGRTLISKLPTIFHIKDGVWRNFGPGSRKTEDLHYLIEQEQWKRLEPIIWLDPGSYHMGILGFLFKIPYMFMAFTVLFTATILVCLLLVPCLNYDLVHLHPLKLPFVYVVLSLFLYPQWSFLEEIVQKLFGLFAF